MPSERPAGGTEFSWCRAVVGGTGITVLAILLSKPPEPSIFRQTLRKIQSRHPLLRSQIQWTAAGTTSLTISPEPSLSFEYLDSEETSAVLRSMPEPFAGDEFHSLLEHELNRNPWSVSVGEGSPPVPTDTFFTTVYAMTDSRAVVALRLHTGISDRSSGVAILREIRSSLCGDRDGNNEEVEGQDGEVNLCVEKLIPKGKDAKPFWARGLDLVGYSVGSLRWAHLEFQDTSSVRASRMVRLQMTRDETSKTLERCKENGVDLSAALTAAGMLAACSSKMEPDQPASYAIAILIDCRSILDPPLTQHHIGFYHSGILNTHTVTGKDEVWEIAKRCSESLSNSMKNNKHFTDMTDVNFLMCKAIDLPQTTPYSSLRTSFMAVFKDAVIEEEVDNEVDQDTLGMEDYIGCASVHGVGPSIAIFDTIRGGRLDCACVYPWPLHSRKQMEDLVSNMKNLLLSGG